MPTVYAMLAEALRSAKPSSPRPILRWAEEEIVLPTGPAQGFRFSSTLQPVAGLWLEELSKGWKRTVLTGPVQSGKTLIGFTIPVLYQLFELNAQVVIAAPLLTTVQDKWEQELLPVIEASRYASRLPRRGLGSSGGKTHVVYFGRGAVLRFMAGSGGDKARASFPARAVFITETDGMDTIKATSREADPVAQLEARTNSYGEDARVGMECTVSHDRGRTWTEYLASTRSRVACPCPACGGWVTPERENLVGWRDARSEVEAGDLAVWTCPACAAELGELERRAMNAAARVLHHGQDVDAGQVVGEPPRTVTLGFRWNAFNNLFQSTSLIARQEWKSAHAKDHVAAERSRMQFVWATPVKPEAEGGAADKFEILDHVDHSLPRGVVPAWCRWLVVGADVGKRAVHWTCEAFAEDATGHVVEYGIQDVQTQELGEERAILQALRALRDRALQGWQRADGTPVRVARMLVDSNYNSDVVHAFAHESQGLVLATMGRGLGQEKRTYYGPRKKGGTVVRIGDGWHVEWIEKKQGRRRLLLFATDQWKSRLRARMEAPPGPGSWTVHAPKAEGEHHSFGKHLAAETAAQQFDSRKGEFVTTWRARRAANHWLDSTVLAEVAASMLGASPLRERMEPRPAPDPATQDQAPRAAQSPRPRRNVRTVGGVRISTPAYDA